MKALIKACLQIGTVALGFFSYRFEKPAGSPHLCLFTYMDGVRREGVDNYFGKLPELLGEKDQSLSVLYLAYVYRPYRSRLKQVLQEGNKVPYLALFGFLRIQDYASVFAQGIREWWIHAVNKKKHSDYVAILSETLVNEIGGYFHNLLVYKAVCRFIKNFTPKVVVYPYENKSL